MIKKVLTEEQIANAIKSALNEYIEGNNATPLIPMSNEEYNQIESLNEMAQINLKERGLEKRGRFDADRYYVYVKGEGGYKKFPHYHIKHKTEGWDIRMNIDGSFHSIKQKSQNRQNDEDFLT